MTANADRQTVMAMEWTKGNPPANAEHGQYEVMVKGRRMLAARGTDGWSSFSPVIGRWRSGLPDGTHYLGPLPPLPKPKWRVLYCNCPPGWITAAVEADTEAEALEAAKAAIRVEQIT